MLSRFSRVRLFVNLWAMACLAPLSIVILQAQILEWVAMPSSRGSSPTSSAFSSPPGSARQSLDSGKIIHGHTNVSVLVPS